MIRTALLFVAMQLCFAFNCQADDLKLVENIPYTQETAPYAVERCKLDVYSPAGKTDCPVVVWFHGGGLEGGNKHFPNELRDCGYVVVAVNYRLLPKCTPAECIDDAAAAVAWTFNNIEQYGGSRKKIFVSGHSAGGYLTMMIGLDKHYLAKYGIDANDITGLIPFSGQCVTHYNVRKLQGVGPLQATIDEYAPLTFVRPDAPPMIIVSGDRELELYGRYEEQAYMWRMMKLVGHQECYIYEMQGFDHGAMAAPGFHVLKQHVSRILEQKK